MIVPEGRQLFHDDIPTMSGCSVIPKTEKQSALGCGEIVVWNAKERQTSVNACDGLRRTASSVRVCKYSCQ